MCGYDDPLGIEPGIVGGAPRHDVLTDREVVDLLADRDDRAGALQAEQQGWGTGPVIATCPGQHVGPVDPRSGDRHNDVARARTGVGALLEQQPFGPTELTNDDCQHPKIVPLDPELISD